ncbi:hypothetical protein PFISCL1PPCAC_8864, partial [Pristionchus fissidentatus]
HRFVGRRKMLLATTIAGTLASGQSSIIISTQISQFASQCLKITTFQSMTLISTSNLSEMLPYETRYLSFAFFLFSEGLCCAVATFHISRGFSIFYFGLYSAISYAIGGALVYYCARDSICHLNIRNDVDVIEKFIREEEKILCDKDPVEGRSHHDAVAKKIFEDLVYLDYDELTLAYFFKKLWKRWAMIEIVFILFQ